MSTPRFHRLILPVAAGALCAVLSIWGWSSDFVTFDETAHIGAGASYVETFDLRLNPEHPPLVKLLAGIALIPLGARVPTDTASWHDFNQWDYGRQFLFENSVAPETLLRVARVPNMLLTLVLVYAVTALSYRWFGWFGATLTGITAAFDTTLLAHGHLVTTDVPVALGYLLSAITFARFLDRPGRRTGTLAFAALAFAVLTKFSAGLLLLLLPTVGLIRYVQLRLAGIAHPWRGRAVLQVTLLCLGGLLLVGMASTGFQVRRPIDDPRIQHLYRERDVLLGTSQLEERADLRFLVRISEPGSATRRALDALARTPVPGYAFFRGIFAQTSHSLGGHTAYLLGQTGNRGWWYYFPVAFAVKTPSGTLVLLGLLGVVGAIGLKSVLRGRAFRRWFIARTPLQIALVLVPTLYLALALTSHINLGVRHLTPVYPFVFLGIGALARVRFRTETAARVWRICTLGAAGTVVVTTLLSAPHFLPAFNSFVGGNRNGWRYLSDSNLDWGQDVANLGRALAVRGVVAPYATVFTNTPFERAVPGYRPIPRAAELPSGIPPPGWYAASWGALLSPDQDLDWLRSYEPAFTVGDSIMVYHIEPR